MVQARVPKGLALSIYGLNGLLPIGQVTGIRRSTSAETVDAILRQRLARCQAELSDPLRIAI